MHPVRRKRLVAVLFIVVVATVAVGRAGAKNAAWLAARILSLVDTEVAATLTAAKQAQKEKVLASDAELQARLNG